MPIAIEAANFCSLSLFRFAFILFLDENENDAEKLSYNNGQKLNVLAVRKKKSEDKMVLKSFIILKD